MRLDSEVLLKVLQKVHYIEFYSEKLIILIEKGIVVGYYVAFLSYALLIYARILFELHL